MNRPKYIGRKAYGHSGIIRSACKEGSYLKGIGKMKRVFLLVTLVSVSISAWGASPAETFMTKTEVSLITCGFQGKLKAMQIPRLETAAAAASMGELSECINNGKKEAEDLYPAAAKSLVKKQEALKAFKRYYAFWMTSMDAFLANVTEGDRVYGMVTDSNQQKLDELYNEYKIELE